MLFSNAARKFLTPFVFCSTGIHIGDPHASYRPNPMDGGGGGGGGAGYPGPMNGYSAAAIAAYGSMGAAAGGEIDIKMEDGYPDLSPNGQRARKNKEDKVSDDSTHARKNEEDSVSGDGSVIPGIRTREDKVIGQIVNCYTRYPQHVDDRVTE